MGPFTSGGCGRRRRFWNGPINFVPNRGHGYSFGVYRRHDQWKKGVGYKRNIRVWRRKDEIVSIFVDNIDPQTTTEMIGFLFEKFGDVQDVFISRKRRSNNLNHFGFVKMKGPQNAWRAIKELRGKWVGNSRIFDNEARFRKPTDTNTNPKAHDTRKVNRIQSFRRTSGIRAPASTEDTMEPINNGKLISVKVNPSMVEELERSLIGESHESRSVEVLSTELTNQWSSIVKWDDMHSAANRSQVGFLGSGGKPSESVAAVPETPRESEQSKDSGKTITLVGNVCYDINEELDLVSKRGRVNVNLGSSTDNLSSEEDYPPGFYKVINTKKFKRNSKPISRKNSKKVTSNMVVLSSKTHSHNLRNEIGVGKETHLEDSIEPWSEDDFDSDPNQEEAKSRELGRQLGLGVGKSLTIDDLLR